MSVPELTDAEVRNAALCLLAADFALWDDMTPVDENGNIWIVEEPPGKCSVCGVIKETRPYGKNGTEICFICGQLDPEETERQFVKRMQGQK